MRALANGDEDALRPIYGRYAPIVFNMASHALDRAVAEEIVQDVFLSLWKSANRYDAARGPLKPWLMQIAHFRILNELRSRSRRPVVAPDADGGELAALADSGPEPVEEIWNQYRAAALKQALERLPATQRQALSLAFFEDLTHEQVADVLQLRLGTAKTRIRAGLARVREQLVPVLGVLGAGMLALVAATFYQQREIRSALARDERALDLVTSSDVVPLRLEATADAPREAHANYRARPGAPVAVLSLSKLASAPAGRVYQAWLLHAGVWHSLGTAVPGPDGRARLVVEGPAAAKAPESLRVTLESAPGSAKMNGTLVLAWPPP